jgi:hypothetical protein
MPSEQTWNEKAIFASVEIGEKEGHNTKYEYKQQLK